VRSLFEELKGAIAVWEVGGSAIAVWGFEGVRSLFGEVEGVRSLFGGLRGCDRCLGVEGCDLSFSVSSVSLWFVKKGCLGKLKGCDSEALLQAVRR
jgi:hypothetical protein